MDEFSDEEGNEGIVNTPKVMVLTSSISNEISPLKLDIDNYRQKSGSSKNIISFKLDPIHNINDNRLSNKKSKFYKKSSTSQSPDDKKKKTVSFSSVQVYRIKNYKKFNKLNTSKVNEDINNGEPNSENCILF